VPRADPIDFLVVDCAHAITETDLGAQIKVHLGAAVLGPTLERFAFAPLIHQEWPGHFGPDRIGGGAAALLGLGTWPASSPTVPTAPPNTEAIATTIEDAIDVACRAPVLADHIRPKRYQAAASNEIARSVDRLQTIKR
jgi:hypothetical protein